MTYNRNRERHYYANGQTLCVQYLDTHGEQGFFIKECRTGHHARGQADRLNKRWAELSN